MTEVELNREIGERIRLLRRQLALTQAKLGAACGVRFQQIHKYEQGSGFSAATLGRIAEALEVSVDYFFEGLPVGQVTDNTGAAGEE